MQRRQCDDVREMAVRSERWRTKNAELFAGAAISSLCTVVSHCAASAADLYGHSESPCRIHSAAPLHTDDLAYDSNVDLDSANRLPRIDSAVHDAVNTVPRCALITRIVGSLSDHPLAPAEATPPTRALSTVIHRRCSITRRDGLHRLPMRTVLAACVSKQRRAHAMHDA